MSTPSLAAPAPSPVFAPILARDDAFNLHGFNTLPRGVSPQWRAAARAVLTRSSGELLADLRNGDPIVAARLLWVCHTHAGTVARAITEGRNRRVLPMSRARLGQLERERRHADEALARVVSTLTALGLSTTPDVSVIPEDERQAPHWRAVANVQAMRAATRGLN